jgi:hypothetical protein
LQELLNHPAVQGGVAPFIVGLAVALVGFRLRLAGLASAAGLLAAVYLIGNFSFETLTATRKIVVVALAAPCIGLLADLAFKPRRGTEIVLGALFGLASIWVFWSVLAQKPLAAALLAGAGVFALVSALVALTLTLQSDTIRAGASGLALGMGVGIGAVLGASALIGQYGMAIGAASGGFLLTAMIFGKRVGAGAALTLAVAVGAGLLGAGAVLLASLPWYSAALFALVPLAARMPIPERSHPALQAIVASLYTLAIAGVSCGLAWTASRSMS